MLSFQFDDLKQAYEECLNRFSKNVIMTSSLHTIRELYLTGKDEYNRSHGSELGVHNALGFRILAASILAAMIKCAIEERCHIKVFRHDVKCYIDGVQPDRKKLKKFLNTTEKKFELLKTSEPALTKWAEVFKIPFSTEVNLNILYYTNHNIDNE